MCLTPVYMQLCPLQLHICDIFFYGCSVFILWSSTGARLYLSADQHFFIISASRGDRTSISSDFCLPGCSAFYGFYSKYGMEEAVQIGYGFHSFDCAHRVEVQEVLPQRLLLLGQFHPLVVQVLSRFGLATPFLAKHPLRFPQVDLQSRQSACRIILTYDVERRIHPTHPDG